MNFEGWSEHSQLPILDSSSGPGFGDTRAHVKTYFLLYPQEPICRLPWFKTRPCAGLEKPGKFPPDRNILLPGYLGRESYPALPPHIQSSAITATDDYMHDTVKLMHLYEFIQSYPRYLDGFKAP
ncbi:Protein of unknown function [Pyronema omphalodes CBS 100304]|uniref:Uncharacterized protein n=1 Tax=Pyronema omphalodes (strain CBS 100304) TaxID=1076935 RepID=U4LS38_PYROM|nr:Protein of unknown function [Pyronema omphalodes CBS 100304]